MNASIPSTCLLIQTKTESLNSPPPILPLTVHHRRQRTDQCHHNCWRYNPRRIHTPVLATASNHIDRNQLQRRNIQNQKRAHFIAGDTLPLSLSRIHGLQTIRRTPSVMSSDRFRTTICNRLARRNIPRRPSLCLQPCKLLHGL